MLRTVFAADEPVSVLHDGELVIGEVTRPGVMTEYVIDDVAFFEAEQGEVLGATALAMSETIVVAKKRKRPHG